MVSMTNKRRDKDVMKMLVSSYKVELIDENKMNEIVVDLAGPNGSAYAHVSAFYILFSHIYSC